MDTTSDTVVRLHQALLQRMRDHSWNRITVSDLAADAGIARQSFYQHFANREDLLLDYVDHMFDAFYNDIAHVISTSPAPGLDISQPLFAQWQRHREFAQLMFRARVDDLLIRRFRSYIARVLGLYVRQHAIEVRDAERMGFMIDYLAGAFWMVLERWVSGNFRYPEDALANLFTQLTRPGFLDALRDPAGLGVS